MIIGLDPPVPAVTIQASELRPVGSIVKLYVSSDPAVLFGFGTWQRQSKGRIGVSVDPMDTSMNAIGQTGGEKAHTLTAAENGQHTHTGTGTMASHSHGLGGLTASTVGAHTHTRADRMSGGMSAPSGAGNTSAQSSSSNTTSAGGHTHNFTGTTGTDNTSYPITVSNAGAGQAHNNLPPYIAVYVWKRTG